MDSHCLKIFFLSVLVLLYRQASLAHEISGPNLLRAGFISKCHQTNPRDFLETGAQGGGADSRGFVVHLYFGETRGQVALAKAHWALVVPPC